MRSEWRVKITYMSGASLDLIFDKKYARDFMSLMRLIEHDVKKAPVYKIVVTNFAPAVEDLK